MKFTTRPFAPVAIVAALLVAVMSVGMTSAVRAEGPKSVAGLAERLLPAVVNISTSQTVKRTKRARPGQPGGQLPDNLPFREFFEEYFNDQQKPKGQQRPRKVNSLGSGFVIDPTGIIVTNNHVIDQADEIFVNFADGKKLKATVKGRDPKTDLAVLIVKPDGPLPFVNMGNSDNLRIGDWVMAIGNPFGFKGTVTLGIVSARNRNLGSGPYDDYIQTDAAINRGNSGGPLFNMEGEVVGVNTAIISRTGGSIGLGFSVPTSIAIGVINQLKEFGETRRGWLGVRIQSVGEDMVESLGLDRARGALVADVTATGPAEKSGVKPGDVILRFNGKNVNEMRDLPRVVAETAVGQRVQVEVLRGGKPLTIEVELGRLEEGEKIASRSSGGDGLSQEDDVTAKPVLGMSLAPLTSSVRERFKVANSVKGTVVTDVTPDSTAADKRIQPGDVISEAGGQPVTSPGDFARQVEKAKSEGSSTILVLVHGKAAQGQTRFIALRLK